MKKKTATKRAGLSADEKAILKETMRDQRSGKADTEEAVLEKIAQMREPDRSMARRVHALVTAGAPELSPKTWYGMPAYARDGKVVCFFQSGQKFKARYATLGFSDQARLDDGDMWATGFALNKLTPAVEAKISSLLKKAAG